MNKVLEFIGFLLICVMIFYLRITVLNKLWILLVVPLGAPALTWLQMFGLSWFLSCATSGYKETTEEEKTLLNATKKLVIDFLSLLMAWGIATLIF
jgi:hypothetical protein